MGNSHKRMKRRQEKAIEGKRIANHNHRREGEWRSGDQEYGVLPERGDQLYRIEEDWSEVSPEGRY